MPAEEHFSAEMDLLEGWDEALIRLFQIIDSEEPGLPEEGLDLERIRGYRSRVGQARVRQS